MVTRCADCCCFALLVSLLLADSDFYQQRLKAWQPILTPGYVTLTFCLIGVVFSLVGWLLWSSSNGVVEFVHQYDGDGVAAGGPCRVESAGDTKQCTISITPTEKMASPVYVYYQLDNFYQNHRRYVKSRDDSQLRGKVYTDSGDLSDCDPLVTDPTTGKILSPCGLIANSFFTDTFTPMDSNLASAWDETGIAWASDVESKFKDPAVAEMDRNTTMYLDDIYPTYPWQTRDDGSKIMVENEHFIVWMRTAALPSFRKLYAKITTDLEANTNYQFNVTSSFYVNSFNGKKYVVLSTTSWLGGKNNFLGIAYVVVGITCFVLGVLFYWRYKVSGRELGDPKYLNWRR